VHGGHVFPAYRRASHGRNYYRIEGMRSFTEIQRIGSRWVVHRVNHAAYPEQVRIMEMLACMGPFQEMAGTEWEALFAGIL
jgi:hypothetical protein